MRAPAAYVSIDAVPHRVTATVPLRGEHDGLVRVLVESTEPDRSFYWTTVLAEDIRVHADGVTAVVEAILWDEAKNG